LEYLHWERREEGKYKSRSGGGNKANYCLQPVYHCQSQHVPPCFMGSEHNMLVMHLHNRLANNKWPTRLIEFLDWLHTKTQEYDVKVLMGDFNMALFRVADLGHGRSRGGAELAGYLKTGMTVALDGTQDSFIVREAGHFWKELGMREKINAAVAEVRQEVQANRLSWTYANVRLPC
jgi:hypothetical protein